jgi:hypothetical protein
LAPLDRIDFAKPQVTVDKRFQDLPERVLDHGSLRVCRGAFAFSLQFSLEPHCGIDKAPQMLLDGELLLWIEGGQDTAVWCFGHGLPVRRGMRSHTGLNA